MKTRKAYPTDLSESEWERVVGLLPQKRTPPEQMREYIDAILSVLHSGCSWRMLPHDFPSWSTVYDVFQKLGRTGSWEAIHDALRAEVRLASDRESEPSVLIGDSQSVKTTEKGGHVATTAGSTSRDANVTSSLTRKAG